MEKDDVMKMVFLEHHRHLSETKLKIQGLTQRTMGVLALASGWIILSEKTLNKDLKLTLALVLILISISSLIALKRFNNNYRTESKLIKKVNNYFKLFNENEYLPKEPVYPDSWLNFGEQPFLKGLGHHVIGIVVMTILPIVAICIK